MQTDRLNDLADRLARAQEKMLPLKATVESLKAEIREILASEGPGEYQAGNHVVTASANRRMNLAAVAEKYPPTEHPHIYKLVPDVKLVRKALEPDEVEQFMELAGDARIGVQ